MQADNRLRAWYTDDLSMGLLYTYFLGDVSPAFPAGVTPLQLQDSRVPMYSWILVIMQNISFFIEWSILYLDNICMESLQIGFQQVQLAFDIFLAAESVCWATERMSMHCHATSTGVVILLHLLKESP